MSLNFQRATSADAVATTLASAWRRSFPTRRASVCGFTRCSHTTAAPRSYDRGASLFERSERVPHPRRRGGVAVVPADGRVELARQHRDACSAATLAAPRAADTPPTLPPPTSSLARISSLSPALSPPPPSQPPSRPPSYSSALPSPPSFSSPVKGGEALASSLSLSPAIKTSSSNLTAAQLRARTEVGKGRGRRHIGGMGLRA